MEKYRFRIHWSKAMPDKFFMLEGIDRRSKAHLFVNNLHFKWLPV